MKKISTNIITVKYMIALCLLAVLAFASFNILLENIKAHERDAAIVNLSGRQRMLSQRIALKAYQLTNPGAMSENAALRSELQNAIHLMEASHNALIHGDSDLGIPGSPSSAVQSMIFSGPVSLDSIVSDYIGKAKEVLDSSGSDSHEVTTNLDSLTLKSNEILAALDAVVHQYQLESESANAQLKHIETLILISFLLVLLLLALFIFRPMVNQIKREARDLERAEKYSRTIMEMVADGLIIINDQGIMKSFNHSAELIFGYSSSDVLEKNIDMLIPEHYCNKHTASFYAYLQENTPKDGPIFEHEVEGMRKDGSAVPLALSVSEIKHDNRRLFISSVRDITKRKEMEEQLRKTAITDELTGLFNRRGFFTLSEKYCKLAKRNQRKMFLLYADLDSMKTINDELGHKSGDQALIDTADILKDSFRESDIVARIGGDEFAVLLTEHSEPDIENVVRSNVTNKLAKHNDKKIRDYELSLSIGIAHFDPDHYSSLEDILTVADESMYKNKKSKAC